MLSRICIISSTVTSVLIFQVMPDWAVGKEEAWRALTARWRGEDEEWNAVSARNSRNRGSGGTHRGGNLSSERYRAKLVRIYIKQPPINFHSRMFMLDTDNISFAMQEHQLERPVGPYFAWEDMRTITAPDLSQPQPEPRRLYGRAGVDGPEYLKVMGEINPEVDDPRNAMEIDERAAIIAGGGREHGRTRVLDKVIPHAPELTLTRVRATLAPEDPRPPPRRRPTAAPGHDVSFTHLFPPSLRQYYFFVG
jgi:hypothetical protein